MRAQVWILVFGLLLGYSQSRVAEAADSNRAMSQDLRDHWSTEDAFPGGQVSSIAQTADGYLWIGGERGLVRFDGLSFRLFQESGKGVPLTHILGLATDAEGGLWVWMQGANVLRFYDGKFENFTSRSVLPDGVVTAMSQTTDGGVLLSTVGQETFEYKRGRIQRIGGIQVPGTLILSTAETSDGKVWVGTSDNGLFYLQSGRTVQMNAGFSPRKVNVLSPGPGNALWIGTDQGLFHWDGQRMSNTDVPPALRKEPIFTIASDRDGSLWAGTQHGLSRFETSKHSTPGHSNLVPTALFEDREGDLWIGSSQGLERWREGVFASYASAPDLQRGNSGPIYADEKDRLWFGPETGGITSLQDGKIERVYVANLSDDVVYSISGAGQDLWLGRQRGGLTHLFPGGSTHRSKTYTESDGLAQNSVYVVKQVHDGTVWAGTLSAGLSRLRNGSFQTYTTANGLASNTVTAIEEDGRSDLWVATPNGVSVLSGSAWRTYSLQNGLPSDEVTALLPDTSRGRNDMWIGTADGIALFSSGQIQHLPRLPDVLHEPVLGLAKDRAGFLWIATQEHILRFDPARLLNGTITASDVREYNHADGLLSSQGVRRSQSMLEDQHGRIWISTRRGIAGTDPAELARPQVLAPVQVTSLLADGRAISPQQEEIPASQRRITLQFAGVSLPVPERVRYRYRLDGFDKEWSEPTAAREAVYTNLGPGTYRFHVTASNSDGLWNTSDTSLLFSIEPAFWQTWWFRLAAMLVVTLMMRWVYLFRTRQLAKQLRLRFEERLAERMRIAQDLHDTLLQGFLSASLQLDVASEYVPRGSPATPMLSRVLALMRQVSEDCRNSVMSLRTDVKGPRNLEIGLSAVPQELGLENSILYRVVVNGQPRALESLCSGEIFLVGREAVLNAYRHAEATLVEVELVYKRTELQLFVRDDGRGIEEAVLLSGKDRHWGLTGMRERAGKVGAQFRVWSRPEKGTEIELAVPGHIAYLRDQRSSFWIRRALHRFTQRRVREGGKPS